MRISGSFSSFAIFALLLTGCFTIPHPAYPTSSGGGDNFSWQGASDDDPVKTGSGGAFCAEVHRGMRGAAWSRSAWGYAFSLLGASTAAVGTVTAGAYGEVLDDKEKAIMIATPLLSGLFFAGAVQAFKASTSAGSAAKTSIVGLNLALAGDQKGATSACNQALADWAEERAAANSTAADAFRSVKAQEDLEKALKELTDEFKKAQGVDGNGSPPAGGGGE